MCASQEKSIALRLAALTLSLAILATAAPASAHQWPHHGFHAGFFAGALGLNLLGGLFAPQDGADSCVEHRPTFDRWGNDIGRRSVNVCD